MKTKNKKDFNEIVKETMKRHRKSLEKLAEYEKQNTEHNTKKRNPN